MSKSCVHFGDTPEGEKISKEMDACLERRLAKIEHDFTVKVILGMLVIFAVIPISMGLACIIRGGNL